MPKVEFRNGQLTIPVSDEVRERLDLHDGDELATHVIEGSVVFTPATLDARERAWRRIHAVTDAVRPTAMQARRPIASVEQEIVNEVKAIRKTRHDTSTP